MRKKIKSVIGVLLAWFFLHEVCIIIEGCYSQPQKSEYAVIFGTTVHENGQMSARLEARVQRGFELYRDSLVRQIVVSGGLGKEGHFEAQVMAQYLLRKGVPASDVIVDDYGNTTWLTVSNFKKRFPKAESVVLVTQYYHVSRSKLACKKIGIQKVSAASASYAEMRDGYGLFREFFAYYKYLLM